MLDFLYAPVEFFLLPGVASTCFIRCVQLLFDAGVFGAAHRGVARGVDRGHFLQRLVTQMYFPGDPLLPLDPIFNGIPDENGRNRLVSSYAHDITTPEWALGYSFDIVVCGPRETPFETKEA